MWQPDGGLTCRSRRRSDRRLDIPSKCGRPGRTRSIFDRGDTRERSVQIGRKCNISVHCGSSIHRRAVSCSEKLEILLKERYAYSVTVSMSTDLYMDFSSSSSDAHLSETLDNPMRGRYPFPSSNTSIH